MGKEGRRGGSEEDPPHTHIQNYNSCSPPETYLFSLYLIFLCISFYVLTGCNQHMHLHCSTPADLPCTTHNNHTHVFYFAYRFTFVTNREQNPSCRSPANICPWLFLAVPELLFSEKFHVFIGLFSTYICSAPGKISFYFSVLQLYIFPPFD